MHRSTKDLTDITFNNLTVEKFAGYKKQKNGKRKAQWTCICECGNILIVTANSLKSGNTKSCGCLNHIKGQNNSCFKDLIKENLPNNIEVIKFLYTDKNWKAFWLFKCHCGKEFEAVGVSVSNGSTKSCGCSKIRFGKDNNNYNPSLTDEEREKGRHICGYKDWREVVYERDNYTCQCCGNNTGGNLNAHHMENYTDNKDLRIITDNGVTLCESCHKKFHKIYGIYHTTAIQTQQFISDHK